MGRQGKGLGREVWSLVSAIMVEDRWKPICLTVYKYVCASRHEDSWVLSTIKERVVSTQYHFDSEEECM